MIGNLIFVGFIVFSIFEFIQGVNLSINNPLLLVSAVLMLITTYLLVEIFLKKIFIKSSIIKNSLIDKIGKSKTFKIHVVIILWMLAIGNFAYANNWIGTPIMNGAEYIDAFVISLISFFILKYKSK